MLTAVTDPELFDRTQWFAASSTRREQLARTAVDQIGADFEYVGLRNYAGTDLEIAVLRHRATDLLFSLIPGGTFEMGMSPEEEQAVVDGRPDDQDSDEHDDFNQEFDLLLSEMGTLRPLHTVRVPPFLIAQRVFNVGQVRRFIDDFTDPLYGPSEDAPAHLSSEQGSLVLIATDLRLPSEAELEYAARGHLTRTLLPTSTRIPDEDILESMLADRSDATSNAYGLHGYGLYPERCADAWHEHYKGAPTDGSPWLGPGPRVVRGGAANCYPWQGCGEWNVMLCAFRMSDHSAEFGSALRLARTLATHSDEPQPLAQPTSPPPSEPAKKSAKKTTAGTTTKKAAKKTAAKATPARTTAKKSSARTTAKKSSGRKTPTKTTAKKSSAKSTTKKAATKTSAKKTPAKTTAKTSSAKTTTKKTAKTTTANATVKTSSAKKSPAKKASRKTPTRKSPG